MTTREPTTHPDALDRIRTPLIAAVLLLALAASQCGCGGAGAITGVAGAVKTTLDVLRQTRAVLCVTALDPLLGDPRADQPTWTTKPAADASTTTDAAGD